jgi:hypothetical protein
MPDMDRGKTSMVIASALSGFLLIAFPAFAHDIQTSQNILADHPQSAIVQSVMCELRGAFDNLHVSHPRRSFIDAWAIETEFTLIVGGSDGSSDSKRTEQLTFYNLVSDLAKSTPCTLNFKRNTLMGLESNLRLDEWLRSTLQTMTEVNVFSLDIRFTIQRSHNSWRITPVTIGSNATLADEVIITLGPSRVLTR